VATDAYDEFVSVYDWVVPDELLTPDGSAAAFLPYLDGVTPGARVLDCACGTGLLAVGLAQRGFEVTATDASARMIERTRALAAETRVDIAVRECLWQDLPAQGFAPFSAVLCIGNSLAHAEGGDARRTALSAMAGLLEPGGALVLTSRNFEGMRAADAGLQTFDRVVERHGRRGVVIYSWRFPGEWDARAEFDVAVALLGEDDTVTTLGERLPFWPYTYDMLRDDLRAAGLEPVTSTFDPDGDRYLLTARRT
jgi:SAM-dependent methyltransferase